MMAKITPRVKMIPVTRQNTRMASALFFLDCPASILSDCFVWCSEEKKKKKKGHYYVQIFR